MHGKSTSEAYRIAERAVRHQAKKLSQSSMARAQQDKINADKSALLDRLRKTHNIED